MNYKDYKRIKMGNFISVGMFGDNIYACEVLTGICDIPGYHQITEDEFNEFEDWKNEKITDFKTLYEVLNRTELCSGYRGHTEIEIYAREVCCPNCGRHFLISECDGDIPQNISLEKICSSCIVNQ